MGTVTDWSKYAPYFKESEFKCKHTGKCLMQSDFMDLLLKLRTKYGKPIAISSGYRDWTHPEEIKKGHKNGEHTKGACADIAISHQDAFEILKLALELGFTRIGVNQKGNGRFLHIGIGGDGLPNNLIWSY